MARQFSAPLTAEDLEWLEGRVPEQHIAWLKSQHGVEDGAEAALAAEKESDEASGDEATGSSDDGGSGSEGTEEDLIGSAFDPAEHTEAEIKEHLEANPDDHDRVLAAEAEGRQRKGVLAL